MAYISSTTRMRDCPPLPECPECGGLECLCRPRFFAGQLLTEQDLNRLESYIIEKNKLHNRYLHGWGVVCGLEVVCSPCAGMVQVKSGYALSPCGEDIIVCKDAAVDVCALIQACRPKSSYPDCEPPRPGSDENCQEAMEEWVLALCYDEQPTRNAPTLRGGGTGCSRCHCGGSPTCGCGCHTNSAGKNAYQPATKPSAPQCEPTLTCEGYVYRVYKAPVKKAGAKPDPGALVNNFVACIQELLQELGALPGANTTPAQWQAWCCAFKEILRDFLVTHGIDDCLLADKLATVRCPDPNSQTFASDLQNALRQLIRLAAEFIRHCLCSALLPPCPAPVTDDCVPLATLTVRRRDCHIVQVCNWGPRRFAVTFPNLGYWLSMAPVAELLRAAIERVCCHPLRLLDTLADTALPGVAGAASHLGETRTMTPARAFSKLFLDAFSEANKARGIDAQTLLLGELGAADPTDPDKKPVMSALELAYPLQFLLLNQMVAPIAESFLPDQTTKLGAMFALTGATTATPAVPAELAALRDTVTQLQSALAQQQARIDELNTRLAKG